jgi:pimeloyl-ACP methyl ester carboxylesterase
MGGLIGVATAHYAPQRLRSLVLGDCDAVLANPEARMQSAAFLRIADAAGVTARWEQAPGGVPARFRVRLLAGDAEALAAYQLYTAGPLPDFRTGLARIPVPTLVYCGQGDGGYADAQAMAAQIPDATFITMGTKTHLEGYAHSEAILPLIQAFLANVNDPRPA